MDLGLILRRLEALETELEALYDLFVRSCESDPSVADTFRGLAHEEHLHADLIKYQIRIYQKNRNQFREIEIDLSQISELTDRIKQLRNGLKTLTPEESLEVAYEIENSAAEHYYVLAGIQSNPEIKNLLKAMASGCTEHHARLAKFFTNTGLEVKTDADFDIGSKDT